MGGRQAGGNLPKGLRYQAFLSYRSTDRALAEWLHRKLESYRTPRSIVGSMGANGPVPRRLSRVFMDREDARTSEDVETILAAELASARDLIVLCSPEATQAASWVSREIEIFRERRPDGVVHAIIGKGRPPTCFPAPLMKRRADGSIQAPLAADLASAPDGDGKQRAVIKLMAGLLGVPFDALWRRERRRRLSLALRVAGLAIFLGLIVGYAGLYATGSARSRAFAAASAFEFNEQKYDRAAFLALSGLPPEGSLISLFWPGDAEAALRRVGQQDLTGVVPPKLAPSAYGGNFRLRHNFLIAYNESQLVETSLADDAENHRSFDAACAQALEAGGDKACVFEDFDLDASGNLLAIALRDGSVWRVARDGSAFPLAMPNCSQAWLGDGLSLQRNETCDPARVVISDDGAFAMVVRRSGAMTTYATDTGASNTYPNVDYCHPQLDGDPCRDAGPDLWALNGDRFVVAGYDRTHVVFAGSGKRFELTGNATSATPGPDGDFTVVLDRGRSATSFSTRYGDELVPEAVEAERTVSIGGCSGIAPETAGEELMGCLTKAVALPPSSADMALAQSNGDILILRLRADSGRQIPDERRIATECLPPSGIVFDVSKRACKIDSMVFSPDGLALAVLDSQGTVSVFRVDDGPLGQSNGARLAAIHMSGRANQVAFGASGDELRIVTGSGALLHFHVPLAEGEDRWPDFGAGHAPYRNQRGGELRATICGRLAGADAGLVRLSDADLAEVSAAFPGLGLTPADQAPCEKRGPLALP